MRVVRFRPCRAYRFAHKFDIFSVGIRKLLKSFKVWMKEHTLVLDFKSMAPALLW